MEQLRIDNTVDIYHQARKIAYSCSVFQTEVDEIIDQSIELLFFLFCLGGI